MALRTPLTAQPHLYIGDSTGRPLDYGRVYFGEPNKDPEFYPIDIYLDPEMTIAAAQPVRTKGGFMDVGGNLAELHAAEFIYSLKVLDQYGRQVFYKPEMYRNNVSDFLVDEIARATAAETLIAGNLTAETQRAIAAEKVIADAVVAEKDRAVAAEDALDSKYATLDNTVAGIVNGRPTTAFATKESMEASALVDGDYAMVTDDNLTGNNGVYIKTAGIWVKSKYDFSAFVKTYMSENGFAILLPLAASNVNYDTASKTLQLRNTVTVSSSNENTTLNTPVDIAIPDYGVYRLEFNSTSKEFRVVQSQQALQTGWLQLGYVETAFNSFTTNIVAQYTVDNKTPNERILTTELFMAFNGVVTLDRAAKTVTVSSNRAYSASKGRIIIPSQTVSYAVASQYYLMIKKADYSPVMMGGEGLSAAIQSNEYWYICELNTATGIAYGLLGKLVVDGGVTTTAPTLSYALALPAENQINFAFAQDKIEISSSIWTEYNNTRVNIPAQTVTLDNPRNKSYRYVLQVNPTSGVMKAVSIGSYTKSATDIVIGAYQEGYRDNEVKIWGLDNVSVNGLPFIPHLRHRKLPHSYAYEPKITVNVNSPNSYQDDGSQPMSDITSTIVYGWYDALMAENPKYITRTLLGNDASGTLPIYQYRFKPKLPKTASARVTPTIPKVMLISIHNEQMNFVYVYNLMEAVCKRWREDDGLTALRNNVEFVIVPAGNPWGLDNKSRTNSNKVDINRNFPVRWELEGVEGDPSYSGTAPLTESESQLIWASMQTEKPDVFYDCHSYGNYRNDGEALWIPAVNHETLAPVTQSILKTVSKYQRKYTWFKDVDKIGNITDDRILGGGLSSKSSSSLGCIGGTMETSWNLAGNAEAEVKGSNIAVNFAADFLGNIILQSIDTAMYYREYPADRLLTTPDRP